MLERERGEGRRSGNEGSWSSDRPPLHPVTPQVEGYARCVTTRVAFMSGGRHGDLNGMEEQQPTEW